MKSTLYTLLLITISSHFTFGQTLEELSDKMMESYSKGDYENAAYYGKKVVIQTEIGKEHEDYALAIIDLALFSKILGHYAEAESVYKESIQIIKEKFGENHMDYAISLNGWPCYIWK